MIICEIDVAIRLEGHYESVRDNDVIHVDQAVKDSEARTRWPDIARAQPHSETVTGAYMLDHTTSEK